MLSGSNLAMNILHLYLYLSKKYGMAHHFLSMPSPGKKNKWGFENFSSHGGSFLFFSYNLMTGFYKSVD